MSRATLFLLAVIILAAIAIRLLPTRNENPTISTGEQATPMVFRPEIPPTVMADGLRRTVTRGEPIPRGAGEARIQIEFEVWTYYGDTIRRTQRIMPASN